MAEVAVIMKSLKVYVAEINHPTYSQVLGVYSTYEKAKTRIEKDTNSIQQSETKWTTSNGTDIEYYITEVTVEQNRSMMTKNHYAALCAQALRQNGFLKNNELKIMLRKDRIPVFGAEITKWLLTLSR